MSVNLSAGLHQSLCVCVCVMLYRRKKGRKAEIAVGCTYKQGRQEAQLKLRTYDTSPALYLNHMFFPHYCY